MQYSVQGTKDWNQAAGFLIQLRPSNKTLSEQNNYIPNESGLLLSTIIEMNILIWHLSQIRDVISEELQPFCLQRTNLTAVGRFLQGRAIGSSVITVSKFAEMRYS